MMKLTHFRSIPCLFFLIGFSPLAQAEKPDLVEVAQSPSLLWNGVAVSSEGRIFVSLPALQGTWTPGVGEVRRDGTILPFPGGGWNSYRPGEDGSERFIGVNAVVTGPRDQLWVVDAAGGFGADPLPGQAKLVRISLKKNRVLRVYRFGPSVLPEKGFINDVRVHDGYAYLTDSGLGALIVLNIKTGESRRVLAEDPRLKADPKLKLRIDGRPYVNAKGETPKMNVNPLELSPDGEYLYFQPNGGPRLYRLPIVKLRDYRVKDAELSAAIEDCGPTRFNAGMTMAPDGSLYYSDVEIGGITRRTPDGKFETVIRDPQRIVWPDASRLGPDGYLYFPAAQINRLPANTPNGKNLVEKPFLLYKVKVTDPLPQQLQASAASLPDPADAVGRTTK